MLEKKAQLWCVTVSAEMSFTSYIQQSTLWRCSTTGVSNSLSTKSRLLRGDSSSGHHMSKW
jgi:hypothetical protein